MVKKFKKITITTLKIVFFYCLLISPIKAQSVPIEVFLEQKPGTGKSKITKIEVLGNTVFTNSEIKAVILSYPEPIGDFSDLRQIAWKLTKLYLDNGYRTSVAFFARQKIIDGVARIKIIEGKLENIVIKGRRNLQEGLILSYFSQPNSLLNINDLQENLTKLQRNPYIKKVDAELTKGTDPSMSVLLLEIEEVSPFEISVEFNNYRPPSIGEYQGIIDFRYSNLIGIGDRLFAQYNLTEGFDAYSLGFSLPINAINGRIEGEYYEGDSLIVEEPFSEADIRAEIEIISLNYRQIIFDSTKRTINLSFGVEKREEQSFLFNDIPFSFSKGAEEGRSAISAISLTGGWIERGATSILAISSQLRFGVDLFDATVNDNAPDGIFTLVRTNLEFAQALNSERNLLFVLRLATQLTSDSLLTSEKITIGGSRTVRGFRQNQELGDNGVVGTLELRIPLYTSSQNQTGLVLIPFIDGGVVGNNDSNNLNSLMSLGLGLSWNFSKRGQFRLDYGVPIIGQNTNNSNSLQESGLSISIKYNAF